MGSSSIVCENHLRSLTVLEIHISHFLPPNLPFLTGFHLLLDLCQRVIGDTPRVPGPGSNSMSEK